MINVNVVQARGRLAQAHLTRPGLTEIDSSPVQNLGTARLPNLDRMTHTDFRKKHEFRNILVQDRRLHKFIIITIIVPFSHDSVIRRGNALGDPPCSMIYTRSARAQCGRSAVMDISKITV